MASLYASYEGKLIGIIESDADERLRFRYDQMWLEDPEHFALSFALPLRTESFGHLETRAFFENLLPEGQVRRRIEARGRIAQDSDFAFLHKYGRDCAGAISISPERDAKGSRSSRAGARRELPLSEVYEALDARRHVAEIISDQDECETQIVRDAYSRYVLKARLMTDTRAPRRYERCSKN